MNSIYTDFPEDHPIWSVSNPLKVRDKYDYIYGPYINRIFESTGSYPQIFLSSQKNQKYMVFDGKKMIHFGDMRYSDFTKETDDWLERAKKRQRYHKRFSRNDMDMYSPYQLSKVLLW